MNAVTDNSQAGTSAFTDTFRRAYEPVRDTAFGAIESGERMVANHPETAVFSSFFLGLLIGGLAGWALAGSLESDWKDELRGMLSKAKGRLNLD